MIDNLNIFTSPFLFIPIIFAILYISKDNYLVRHKKKKYKNTVYYQSVTKNKGNITGFRIGLKLSANIHLAFTRKNKNKSNDLYMQSNEFDDMISLSIESISIDRQCIIDEIKDIVLSIFHDTSCNCTIDKIYTFQDRIWLTIDSNLPLSNREIDFVTDNIFERFHLLNEKLKLIISQAIIPRSKEKVKKETLEILSFSILLYGGFHFFFALIEVNKIYSDIIDWQYLACVTIFPAMLVCLILKTIFTLGINKKYHILDGTILLMLIGIYLTIYPMLLFTNAYFDYSQPISHLSTVQEKKLEHRGRGHSNSHILIVSTQHKHNYKLHVSDPFYNQISLNEKLIITEKKGLFNASWISSYKNYNKNLVWDAYAPHK